MGIFGSDSRGDVDLILAFAVGNGLINLRQKFIDTAAAGFDSPADWAIAQAQAGDNATAMRYNGPKGTLTIDVARIRGEEDNKNVFSTGLIGSAFGHELVHMSQYTFGKYDGSALSRARAEVGAFN